MPRISQYGTASAVTDDDVFLGLDGGDTVQVPASVAKTYFQSGLGGGAGGGDIVTIGPGTNLAALQAAVTVASAGDTIRGTPGTTYTQSAVWEIEKSVGLDFRGCVIHATDDDASAINLLADDIDWRGGRLTVDTSERGNEYEDMRLLLGYGGETVYSGIRVRDVHVDGSHAVGIFVVSCSDWSIEDVRVTGTLADGIHVTGGSTRGQILRARCWAVEDDGIGLVGYASDGAAPSHIEVVDPVIWDNIGRGVSFVGAQHIRVWNPVVRRCSHAGLYIANEPSAGGPGSPSTEAGDIWVYGGQLWACNHLAPFDHGAVLVYSGTDGDTIANVNILGTEIWDAGLAPSASAALQLKNEDGDGGTASGISFGTTGSPVRLLGDYSGLSFDVLVESELTLASEQVISGGAWA